MAVKTAMDPETYANRVRDLFIATFGLSERDWAEQDEAWNDWLKATNREWRDVDALLTSDIRDVFKARAKALQLTFEYEKLPFDWNGNRCLQYSQVSLFSDLSPALFSFATALLELNAADAGARYERNILEALIALPEDAEVAACLFEHYELNDPELGFGPFRSLLSSDVPEKWKRLADTKMRQIILAEEGHSKPREEHKGALDYYARHVTIGFYSKKFPYGDELLASQIGFILGLPNLQGREFFSLVLKGIVERITGDDHADLRHRLARHAVLEDRGKYGEFKIYSADKHAFATAMLEEFGERDPELGEKLRSKIAEGDQYKREQDAVANAQKARENAALDRMR